MVIKRVVLYCALLLVAVVLLLLPVEVSAAEVVDSGTCGDNLTWVLTDDGVLTISGTGEMYDYEVTHSSYQLLPITPWYQYRYSIDTIIIEEGVTSIGEWAFSLCFSFDSIYIPGSVADIGGYAFRECNNLSRVTIGNGITSVGSGAFDLCSQLTEVYYDGNLSDWLTITFNGNPLSNGAYLYCKGTLVTEVEIPSGITSIGEYAFDGCTSLTSVNIPDSITSIGMRAFSGCSRLTSVNIPDSVTSIGGGAFDGCTNLTSVNIPDSVTSIGGYAFYKCARLNSITIGNGVTSIGSDAFFGCNKLTDVYYNGNVADWLTITFDIDPNDGDYSGNPLSNGANLYCKGTLVTEVEIPSGITSIREYALYGCTSLTSVNIPNSVTSIGDCAFYGCTSLTSVNIPDSVTSLEWQTFYGCTSLTSVTIGNSVTSLEWQTFYGCTSLTSVTIGNSVTTIRDSAFGFCRKITDVYYEGNIDGWRAIEFEKSGTGFYSNPLNYGANLYFEGELFTEIKVPTEMTSDYMEPFKGCTSLVTIIIPEGASIPGETFRDFANLTTVIIQGRVQNIGYAAFSGCKNLWHVILTGDEADWNWIIIESGNEYLENATRHYNCTGDEVTDPANKVCSLCTPACEHTWDGGKVTKEATCKDEGVKSYTCAKCGQTKTESIAKTTNHKYDNGCDADCNVCGATRTVNHNYGSTWHGDGTGHWKKCTVCGKAGETSAHTWDSGNVTKEPTCAEEGVKTFTCTACKHTKTEAISKTDKHLYDNACDANCNRCGAARSITHSYGKDWKHDKDAHWHECTTCGHKADNAAHTPGTAATESKAQTCTVCGYVITPALGHTHKWGTNYSSNQEQHWLTCSGCSEKKDAENHKWDKGTVTKAPTCEETGEMTYTCTVCGKTKTEAVDVVEHTPGPEATETEPQVCTVCGKILTPATGSDVTPTVPPTEPGDPTSPPTTAPTEPGANKPTTPSVDDEPPEYKPTVFDFIGALIESPVLAILLVVGVGALVFSVGTIVATYRKE